MAIDNPTPEQWVPVPGWDGLYEVSSMGNVRRKSKSGYSSCSPAFSNHKGHYAMVRLCEYWTIHALVATSFIGPRPGPYMVCNHKNGDKSDNRPENLEWVTQRDNIQHALSSGLMGKGKRHWKSNPRKSTWKFLGSKSPKPKLNESQVSDIKMRISRGQRAVDIAAIYGVDKSTICAISNGRTWNHVEWPHV